jgi:3-dehydroquinate synthetase
MRRRLLSTIKLDKKAAHGEVKFVLAPRLGETVTGQRVSDDLVDSVLATAS